MLSDAPYFSQEDSFERGDPTDADGYGGDCGPATFANALALRRQQAGLVPVLPMTINDLSRDVLTSFSDFSITADLWNLGRRYGLDLQFTSSTRNLTLPVLREEIDGGNPVICLILYQHLKLRMNQAFTGGHFVLAVGYDDAHILIHDPDWWGSRRGQGAFWPVPNNEFDLALNPGENDYFSVMRQGLFVRGYKPP